MIHKRLHKLNTNVLGRKVPHDYKDRGKYSRMWATPSTTINDIVNILFKAYPIKKCVEYPYVCHALGTLE